MAASMAASRNPANKISSPDARAADKAVNRAAAVSKAADSRGNKIVSLSFPQNKNPPVMPGDFLSLGRCIFAKITRLIITKHQCKHKYQSKQRGRSDGAQQATDVFFRVKKRACAGISTQARRAVDSA
jgi:hypothetical protein